MPETPSLATRVADLLANIPQLPESRRSFAQSMCDQFARRGTLSPAQEHWVDALNEIARDMAQGQRMAVTQVGDLTGIMQLFARAAPRLRHPAIVLSVPAAGDLVIRLSIATERARVPGSINVSAPEQRDTFGRPVWYGRIMQDGNFVGTTRATPTTVSLVTDRLREFAADPARIAGEHGRLTGRCCFCNLRLTEERSTAMGYGPVCAGHYGLPWGAREVAAPSMTITTELRAPEVFDASQVTFPAPGNSFVVGRGVVSVQTPGGYQEIGTVESFELRPDTIANLAQGRVLRPAETRARTASRPLVENPPASATRIDEMPLGPRGDLE